MKIPGLPEGIEVTRIGIADANEYEVTNDPTNPDPPLITKGARPGSASQIVIRPAEGYAFKQKRIFDIRQFEWIDQPFYDVVRVLKTPAEISGLFKFSVDTEEDRQMILKVFERLQATPGYVSGP